ncbi:MAG: threonine--tRNA ligase [Deltaproteobacteria bacterium]|nr:threonine--tRNA ligase [Deltaproteobacteria bacterium]
MSREHQDPQSPLYKIRHSLAHVLAQAVLEIRPDAKLGFGPPIENGFYYDFDLEQPLVPEDLPLLEKAMRKIIGANQKFEREELPAEEMIRRLTDQGAVFKAEQAQDLKQGGEATLSLYKNGPFNDMCEGPHVESTGKIPADGFKLDSLAGAYWKGSEKNKMLQRVYGLAFENKQTLKDFLEKRELAKERDHRKLGVQMELFTIADEVGKGLPLWLPNGTVIRDELENLAKETEFRYGYQRVATPHITKEGLFLTSGHLPYYADSMFPPMVSDGETFYLKPMNCPLHHMIYKASPRSYRELPLRLAEYGTCYRYEQSGELSGLLRVRGLTMNDAHIYCAEEQTREEFVKVMRMHIEYYRLFGITDYWVRLSLPDLDSGEKYVGGRELWERAETLMTAAMEEAAIPYEARRGEAAFYGPKIDMQIRNVMGREETASTNQLDLIMADRFDLSYIGRDNQRHRPHIIHRAPLGTHERFAAFLIEHYGGIFPTWLAPRQVRVIPINPEMNDYAHRVVQTLRDDFVRAEVDDSNDTLGKKIRNGAADKVPNLFIAGAREMEEGKITWQRMGSKQGQSLPLDEARTLLLKEIKDRTDWRRG